MEVITTGIEQTLTRELSGWSDPILHAQAHLFARFPHPDDFLGGEVWMVDLKQGWCEGLDCGEVIFEGTVELLGSYEISSERWSWAWSDPAAPASSYQRIRSMLAGNPAVARLVEAACFHCPADQAEELANWLAIGLGAVAAYPGPLAGKLQYTAVFPQQSDRAWCTLCGQRALEGASLIEGRYGMACRQCLQEMADMAAAGYHDAAFFPGMVSCVLCGTTEVFRVFCATTAVCLDCIDQYARG